MKHKRLCYLLCTAHDILHMMMLPLIAFHNIDLSLSHKTSLLHIRIRIYRIMEKCRVKREPYNRTFVVREGIYYNKETPFCLISENNS